MFAIQINGDKFLHVKYFIDPKKVFKLVVSRRPQIWKTQEEASNHLSAAREYIVSRIAHMNRIIDEANEAAWEAKEEANLRTQHLRYKSDREVEKDLKELFELKQKELCEIDAAKTYTKIKNRFKNLEDADLKVVRVQQVVSLVE